ncbi:RodZ domain-containing protein [Halomonas organivorans]|uniref:Cytoskeleton protein RodZ n=1 Tax=Halomonas organivorans TaxID=257772 RepID=A0A7W5BUR3_9GAMM|nr:RodZ domain-containing protein [Halomonas organivorans]MBB3139480.1 cytoskeleton protein RodZ [Halomonas organivorans]
MSDTPYLEPDANASQASPGELLRREREALELSRDEVAEALNLRPAVIEGLENDIYDEVPIATYRRGYLRSYANLLGMDAERVLAAYQARFGSEDTERKVTPVHVVNKPPSRLGAWLFRLATLLVIAGLVGLTLLWWQSRGGSQPPTPGDNAPVAVDSLDGTTVTEGGEPATADDEATERDWSREVATDAGDDTSANDDARQAAGDETPAERDAATPDAPAQAASATSDATAETEGNAADASAAPQAGEEEATEGTEEAVAATGDRRVLELTFNEQSWTEIFDANGQRIFVGLQEPGTTARVEGEPPFRLTVGNATGVELAWHGDPVDLAPRTGANNVARFTLGE